MTAQLAQRFHRTKAVVKNRNTETTKELRCVVEVRKRASADLVASRRHVLRICEPLSTSFFDNFFRTGFADPVNGLQNRNTGLVDRNLLKRCERSRCVGAKILRETIAIHDTAGVSVLGKRTSEQVRRSHCGEQQEYISVLSSSFDLLSRVRRSGNSSLDMLALANFIPIVWWCYITTASIINKIDRHYFAADRTGQQQMHWCH